MKIKRTKLAKDFTMVECVDGKKTVLISEGGISVEDGVGSLMIELPIPKDTTKLTDEKIEKIAKKALKQYNEYFEEEDRLEKALAAKKKKKKKRREE